MTDELETLHNNLIHLIQQATPKASKVEKYGGILFSLKPDEKEGQFCGVFSYKAHVQISFSDGVHLDDPGNLLSGSGKGRRHINFKAGDKLDKKAVTKMIRQAAKISLAAHPD